MHPLTYATDVPHTTIVSTALLANELGGNWVVIDCRYDLGNEAWGLEQYRAGHIPGAVYASLSHDMSSAPNGRNGRHPIPPVEVMAATFGRLGIGPGTQVVAYDQENGMYASRLWWMLRYLGHDAVAVLDGGWARWVREGRPTRAGDERHSAKAFVPAVRADLRLSVEDVERVVRDGSLTLVDARAPERFEGKSETLDRAAGHIPGARNHFFKDNVAADGTLLPVDTLRAQFSAAIGDRQPGDVVMYCGSGVTACQNLLALEHAGITGVKLYPGSWSEWSADPGRPIETGPPKTK